MTKIIIIEDEPLAANRLETLIYNILPDAVILHKLETVSESVKILKSDITYDLLFMDIHLADGNSFDILDDITITKPIIMTTAYDKYALPAFRHFVIDYLLKPIRRDDLNNAINKFLQLYAIKNSDDNKNNKKWTLKIGNQIKIIAHDDVLYYFTIGKINYIMLHDGKKYPIDRTMEQIANETDILKYFRVNRQYIISRDAIVQILAHTKSRFLLKLQYSDSNPVVSTERSPEFKKWVSS